MKVTSLDHRVFEIRFAQEINHDDFLLDLVLKVYKFAWRNLPPTLTERPPSRLGESPAFAIIQHNKRDAYLLLHLEEINGIECVISVWKVDPHIYFVYIPSLATSTTETVLRLCNEENWGYRTISHPDLAPSETTES